MIDTSVFYFALHLERPSKKSASIIGALVSLSCLGVVCYFFITVVSSPIFVRRLKIIFLKISFSCIIPMLTLFCLPLFFFSFSPICVSTLSIRSLVTLLDRLHIQYRVVGRLGHADQY